METCKPDQGASSIEQRQENSTVVKVFRNSQIINIKLQREPELHCPPPTGILLYDTSIKVHIYIVYCDSNQTFSTKGRTEYCLGASRRSRRIRFIWPVPEECSLNICKFNAKLGRTTCNASGTIGVIPRSLVSSRCVEIFKFLILNINRDFYPTRIFFSPLKECSVLMEKM